MFWFIIIYLIRKCIFYRKNSTKNKKNTYPLDLQIIETSANISFFFLKRIRQNNTRRKVLLKSMCFQFYFIDLLVNFKI